MSLTPEFGPKVINMEDTYSDCCYLFSPLLVPFSSTNIHYKHTLSGLFSFSHCCFCSCQILCLQIKRRSPFQLDPVFPHPQPTLMTKQKSAYVNIQGAKMGEGEPRQLAEDRIPFLYLPQDLPTLLCN